jgi:predicted nucleic acid-binding protein
MGRIGVFARIYLDSNIIISAFSGDAQHEVVLALGEMIGAVMPELPQAPFGTSELTLAEVLVRALRAGDSAGAIGMDNVITSSGWLEVALVSRAVLRNAALLRSRYPKLKLPDAIHVASAIELRCSHVLTADLGLADAYSIGSGQLGFLGDAFPVEIIRPNIETLKNIVDWLGS